MSGGDRNSASPGSTDSDLQGAATEPVDRNGFARNNAISVFLMGALPAVAGSAISVLLAAFFIWGLVSLLLRRFEFRLTHNDRVLAWTFTGFVTSVFATAMIADNRLQAFPSLVWLLPFLSVWVLIPRLRASPGVDYLHIYICGAAVGAVGAMLLATVQFTALGLDRPTGGAGNAAVFACMSLVLAAIAGLNVTARDWRWRSLAPFAVFAGLVAVTLSMTRGVWIAAIPVTLVLLLYAPRAFLAFLRKPWALLLIVVAVMFVMLAGSATIQRYAQTLLDIELVLEGERTSTIGERLRLWQATIAAIADSPIWGHGVQNRMMQVYAHIPVDDQPILIFTHAHNGILSAALDGGILVVIALLAMLVMPVVVAYRARGDESGRKRLFLAILVSLAYVSSGMTQIMFKHDIMDSFFIFNSIVVAATIVVATPDKAHR